MANGIFKSEKELTDFLDQVWTALRPRRESYQPASSVNPVTEYIYSPGIIAALKDEQ